MAVKYLIPLCFLAIASASVSAQSWTVTCKTDPMDDSRSCQIADFRKSLFFFFQTNRESVCILGHDFPGRVGAIRVDKGKPVSVPADECVANKRLISDLLKGRQATTRRYEWPYDYPKDQVDSLSGLSAAFEEVRGVLSPSKKKKKSAGEPLILVPEAP